VSRAGVARLGSGAVALFFAVLYLLPLNFRGLWIPDETRYAEISREMLASGNWIDPHLLGLRYFEKPVGGYWINNIAQWLTGHHAIAVRLGPAVATGIGAALIFWLALRLWGDRAKAGAVALVYLSMLLVYGVGTYGVLDAMFTVWLTAAMVCFWPAIEATTTRGRMTAYALMGACCGGAFLTKGFIGLAVPVIAILPYMVYRRRFVELLCFGPIAIVAAAVVSLPWALAVQWQEPDYWRYFFWVQNIQRFAESDAQHPQPIWYFLPVFLLGCLPWLGVVPAALGRAWTERASQPGLVYALCWFLFPLIFFSLSKGKLVTYILPCFAPVALLVGTSLIDGLRAQRTRSIRINALINAIFGLLLVIALIWLAVTQHGPEAVYGPGDTLAWWLSLLCFAGWGLFGLVPWFLPRRAWMASALSPALLALLLAWATPHSVTASKQPDMFIARNAAVLSSARIVMADDVGLATSLGWSLKRSDIRMYDATGELSYGLRYSGVHDKHIAGKDFSSWLEQQRKQGSVALLLKEKHAHRRVDRVLQSFPPGYRRVVGRDLILLVYPQEPAG
jgi:4-amino-4-deoxy-L-arabinose transferase